MHAAWAGHGTRILLLGNERLYLFDPSTEPMTELDSVKAGYTAGYGELATARDGALAFIYSRWGAKKMAVFACVDDKLRKVAQFKAPVWFDHEHEGRVIVGAAGGARYELFNLADDPFEKNNLADKEPNKLKRIID